MKTLLVDVTTPEKVAFSLGLPDSQALVEVAVLKGNDFTRPFLKNMNLRQHLGLRNFSLQNFAGWVTRFGSLENSDYFWHAMRTDPEFHSAVRHSRQFYAAAITPAIQQQQQQSRATSREDAAASNPVVLSSLIESGVSRGDFPIIFLAMHRGFYWHRELLGVPNVETALLDLRRFLYDLIVPSTSGVVAEFYRSAEDVLERRNVSRRGRYPELPELLHAASEGERIAVFSDIFLSLEEGGGGGGGTSSSSLSPELIRASLERDFVDLKERFLVLTLRYFFKLTRAFDLILTLDEAEAVVASLCYVMSVCRAGGEGEGEGEGGAVAVIRRRTGLVPSFRCLTIFNWLQEIYLYAFNLFGKALKLAHHFPRPSDLFAGSTFVYFFTFAADSDGLVKDSREVGICKEEVRILLDQRRPLVDAILVDYEIS